MILDKLRDLIVRAFVARTDETTPIRYLQVGVFSGELQDDVEHFEPYGYTSAPLTGAEVLLTHLDGDRSHPIAAVVTDRRYRPTGLRAGEIWVFDNLGRKIYLSADGIKVDGKDSPITVTTSSSAKVQASEITLDAPTVTVTGNLFVKGRQRVDGQLTGGGISLAHHVHGGVKAGSETSGTPNNGGYTGD